AVAVVIGAAYFLVLRLRARRLPDAVTSFAIAPLLLLLVVALTGLALPASRGLPLAFRVAAALHQTSVWGLLVRLPFSKLGHVIIRPLQLGARAVRAAGAPQRQCSACGTALAPAAQHQAVTTLLAARGIVFAAHLQRCPACRRREVAGAQAALIGAHFQPQLVREEHTPTGRFLPPLRGRGRGGRPPRRPAE